MTNKALHLPDTEPDLKFAPPYSGARPVSLEDVAAAARASIPEARLTQINMPGARGVYRASFKFAEDGTPLGRSFVLINAYSGAVLYTRSAHSGGTYPILPRVESRDPYGGYTWLADADSCVPYEPDAARPGHHRPAVLVAENTCSYQSKTIPTTAGMNTN